jgi:hypothetical protein
MSHCLRNDVAEQDAEQRAGAGQEQTLEQRLRE